MSPERSESKEKERLRRRGEEDEAPEVEEQAPSLSEDRGASVGDPDVQLDVPVLNVDELELEVEDLRARVSFQAELADMVKINVGIDAEVGRAKIEIQGVEAQAQLKARLDNVRAIFSEVLTALERDPDLAQNMLRSGGPLDDLLGGEASTAGGRARSAGPRAPENEGTGSSDDAAGEGASSLADLQIEEEYIDEQGRVVGRARDESGRDVEEILDEEGNSVDPSSTAGTGEGEGSVDATDAARRRAEELGLALSGVKGTGSGGRILVKDVEEAGRDGA